MFSLSLNKINPSKQIYSGAVFTNNVACAMDVYVIEVCQSAISVPKNKPGRPINKVFLSEKDFSLFEIIPKVKISTVANRNR